MMSREDILRELELLPVWQLRHPIAETNILETEQPSLIEQDMVNDQPEVTPSAMCRVVVSADGQWLFVLKQQHSTEAETLFHNMLKAVAVKIGKDVVEAQLAAVVGYTPKVIVAMGEEVAQQWLTLTQPLAELRSKPHTVNDIPVIVTYAPDDLLQNVADKAGAWEDLCLAKATIANL